MGRVYRQSARQPAVPRQAEKARILEFRTMASLICGRSAHFIVSEGDLVVVKSTLR